MLTYTLLKSKPTTMRSVTGLTPAEFERLYRDVAARYELAEDCRLARPNRKRRRGAGRKFRGSLEQRMLLVLVWLRVYPTYEVMGILFGLDQSRIGRQIRGLLPLLRQVASRDLAEPPTDQRKRTWPELLRDFPDVAVIIDATEQRIRRPKDTETQKRYYSGKKKVHSIKTQVTITPDRQLCEVSDSVPGSVNDLTLLRESQTVHRLQEGRAMMDAGYQGIAKDVGEERIAQAHRASRGHPLTPEQRAQNRVLAKPRVRVEHVIADLKVFQVLTQVYRHPLKRYNDCIMTVAALSNRRRGFVPELAR
jgi:hypothetical protein